MVSVKNQYKNSYKKKQNLKQYKRAHVPTGKKKTSDHQANQKLGGEKRSRMEGVFKVQRKQVIQQNDANCLKNKKLQILKMEKDQKQLRLDFVFYSKQLSKYKNTSNTQSKFRQQVKENQSSKFQQFIQDNQDVYLKSHVGQEVTNNVQSEKARFKTEEFDAYLSDQYGKQSMLTEKNKSKVLLASKSQAIRVISAFELTKDFKKDFSKGYQIKSRSYEPNKANKYYKKRILTKSAFEGDLVLRNVNGSFNLVPSKNNFVYSSKKPVTRSRRSYIDSTFVDNFKVTSNKRKSKN